MIFRAKRQCCFGYAAAPAQSQPVVAAAPAAPQKEYFLGFPVTYIGLEALYNPPPSKSEIQEDFIYYYNFTIFRPNFGFFGEGKKVIILHYATGTAKKK
jgi:hypothetical protein